MRARAQSTPARKFTREFQEQTLALLRRSDRTLPQVAADLGISKGTLRNWYNRSMAKKPVSVAAPADEPVEAALLRLQRENALLQKRIAELEEDRAILKKAAAFFAKESE